MKKILLILCLAVIFQNAFTQKQAGYDPMIAAGYDMLNGKAFEDLMLEDTAGNIFHTSSLLGKTIYIDFWFTACAPCLKEIPYSKTLQSFFAADSNVAFLSICIESIDRKPVWKEMIKEKEITGIHLFYARNRPQQINLLREYKVTFPTYILLDKEMKVTGYDAPRPSESWTQWAIEEAEKGKLLSTAYREMTNGSKEFMQFMKEHPIKQ